MNLSIIEKENKELYIYGFFMLLSQVLYFLESLIIGYFLNVVIQSSIFYVSFSFIRRYAGGYHAYTETRCELSTTFSILVCISVIKLSYKLNLDIFLLIIGVISGLLILILCPLDTPEKPLSKTEYKYFKKISWLILFIISVLIVISYIVKWKFLYAPCCMSLILEAILISAGKIQKSINNKILKLENGD